MATTETITIAGNDITSRELTVKQVKEMLETVKHDQVINNIIDDDIPAEAVALACNMSIEELEEHLPSQLLLIWENVRKTNPSLAGMVKNTTAILEQLENISKSLPAVSADSSN